MNIVRALLGIVGGASAGYAIAALVFGLGDRDFGVALAISAGCVLGIYLIKAVQADRQRDADKAYHPASQDIGRCMDCGTPTDLDALYLRGGLCLNCTHVKSEGKHQ